MIAADDADDCRRAAELRLNETVYSSYADDTRTLVAFVFCQDKRVQCRLLHIGRKTVVCHQMVVEVGANELRVSDASRLYLGDTVPVLAMTVKCAQNQRTGRRILLYQHPVLIHLVRVVGHVSLLRLSREDPDEDVFVRVVVHGGFDVHVQIANSIKMRLIPVHGESSSRSGNRGRVLLLVRVGFQRHLGRNGIDGRQLIVLHSRFLLLLLLLPHRFGLGFTHDPSRSTDSDWKSFDSLEDIQHDSAPAITSLWVLW